MKMAINQPQNSAPYGVRIQPMDTNYQFVPQQGARISPIPGRFEGQIPFSPSGPVSLGQR